MEKEIIKFKKKQARQAEVRFENLCKMKGVDCLKLDNRKNAELRREILINPDGKCPDYLCLRGGKSVFVEVKTITNITNEAREEKIKKQPKNEVGEAFDPKIELKTPLKTKLVKASKKFDNVKSNEIPTALVLCGFCGSSEFFCKAIFAGAYDSYKKADGKLVNVGFRKTETGLLDEHGNNVSTIIYWNDDEEAYGGFGNPKAQVEFKESSFFLFFGKEG